MDAQSFLGLEPLTDPLHWRLPVTPGVSSPANSLFGGVGLAAGVTAMENASGRPLVWATAQYLRFARTGSVVDFEVILAAVGRQTTQARAVGRVDGEEILTVNAALGYRPDQPTATWAQPPTVPPPLASPARPIIDEHRGTLIDRIETRLALGRQGEELDGTHAHHGRSALWCRMPGGLDPSSASLAVLGDFMPSGIGFALGVNGGGTSLDNTIRVLHLAPTEWVLCDIEVYGVANGYGHGRAHLWAEDGTLLGTASQSVVVRRWDQ